MPIPIAEAAAIARAAGLTLSDADALAQRAANTDEARALAEQFRPAPATLDEQFRVKSQQLAELFARTDHDGRIHPTAEEPQP